MKKNEDGYILLWTFMALTLFVLLISALLALGSGMLLKSKRSAAGRQQMMTAKSVVDVLADAVCSRPEETPGREILEKVESAQKAGEDYDSAGGQPYAQWERVEGLPKEMGQCGIRIWYQYQEQTIAISACAGGNGGDAYVLTLLLCPEDVLETAEASSLSGTGTQGTDEGLEALSPGDSGAGEQENGQEDDQDFAMGSWRPCRYREETR